MATFGQLPPSAGGVPQQGISAQPGAYQIAGQPQPAAGQTVRYPGATIPGQAPLGYAPTTAAPLPAGATLAGGYQAAPRVIQGGLPAGYQPAYAPQVGAPAGYYEGTGSPQVVRVAGQPETSPLGQGNVIRRVGGPMPGGQVIGGIPGYPAPVGLEALGQPTGAPGTFIDAQGRTVRRLDGPPPGYAGSVTTGIPQYGYDPQQAVRRIEQPGQIIGGGYVPQGAQVIQGGIPQGYYRGPEYQAAPGVQGQPRVVQGQLPPYGLQQQVGAPIAGQQRQAVTYPPQRIAAPAKEEDSTPLC